MDQHGPVGKGPEESHKADQSIRVRLLRRQVERVWGQSMRTHHVERQTVGQPGAVSQPRAGTRWKGTDSNRLCKPSMSTVVWLEIHALGSGSVQAQPG